MAGEVEEKGQAIGIDLGTTYSCVGVWLNGRVEIIVNGHGTRTTPSYVAFTDTDDKRLVGDAAKGQVARNPANTVFDAKRLIGRKFSDPTVQNDIKLWPFKVIAGANDKPMIVVRENGEEKQYSAEDISSMVLAEMREIAETFLGTKVKDAVITIPAYFNNSQRLATKDAGRKAGLNVLQVINEPTAAAIAYGLDEKAASTEGKKNVLVFDLGGGTFDVSVVTIDAGAMKVVAKAGDSHLGGVDFDNRLVSHCVEEFERRHGKDMSSDPRALRRLRTACEKAKRILSHMIETPVDIDSLYEGIDFQTTISTAMFEELNMDLFMKCMELVDQCLEDAKMDKNNVEEVVLVGGSTRIPKIQELLKESFLRSKICKGVNPDEAVAMGAAIHAAMLGGESSMRFEDMVPKDVTPLSLGMGIAGGLMSVLIPKNTPIPVRKEKIFTTSYDDQTLIKFTVFEGERTMASENNLLGQFELSGIPPGPKFVRQIPVSFEINADGILVVSVEDPTTKVRREITIAKESGWSSNQESDNEVVNRKLECRVRLDNYAKDLRNMIRNEDMSRNMRSPDRKKMEDGIQRVLAWLQSNQQASDEEFEAKRTELERIWAVVYAGEHKKGGSKGWRIFLCFKR